MVFCIKAPGKCTPSDFAAGRETLLEETLLEQMFYNVSVP